MSTLRAQSSCHTLAQAQFATRLDLSSTGTKRRHRAIVMLLLFGFVLLRTLTVCHEPENGTTHRLGVQAGIEALIASAFCGTLDMPVSALGGGTTSHTSSAMCLHCASGCHGVTGLGAFWMLWAFGLAVPLIMRINRDTVHANLNHRDNRVRGPPAG
jgi:hypothetical protein